MAAGLVLGTSWSWSCPGWLLDIARAVAAIAVMLVLGGAWRASRRAGRGLLGSTWHAVKAFGHFVTDFF